MLGKIKAPESVQIKKKPISKLSLICMRKEKKPHPLHGERMLFSRWCCENWISTCRGLKQDVTLYQKQQSAQNELESQI